MAVVIVTGSAGLIGSEAVSFFCQRKYEVVGIDNNLRKRFFGDGACTDWNKIRLERTYPTYRHMEADIRDAAAMQAIFSHCGHHIKLIIHAAAQPSHDWAARDPYVDFTINAQATLILLECFRQYCPEAVFIFTSTNKVYGNSPNFLSFQENTERYEIDPNHKWYQGIDETMSIDQTLHSLFGVSKAAADLIVQEYGKYFQLKTGVFRGGCVTGPRHSGVCLHGFLSYLMKCCVTGEKYTIYGHKGKQVRDNIHSRDFVRALYHFYQDPRPGEVYNIGGGRVSNCSILEAIDMCEKISDRTLSFEYVDQPRLGDHVWWISNMKKFRSHYPEWDYQFNLNAILQEIFEVQKKLR
jgi:CDP-paratose 2-epimerase